MTYWIDWERFEKSNYFDPRLRPDIPVTIMWEYPIFFDEHTVQVAVIKQDELRGLVIPIGLLIKIKETAHG